MPTTNNTMLVCVSALIGGVLSLPCLADPPQAADAASPAAISTAAPPAAQSGAASSDTEVQEVTITATKFNSTVQSTPISITALSGAALDAAGITSVEDLTRDIPGLSMRSAGPGQTEYEARGLASSGGAAPTVGFYLDEIPLSPPALAQVGKVVIDPDLYDLNRIEVLRGPQGTLYGSGSMGGTIRLISNQPQLGTFDGSAQSTVSGTVGGGVNGGANLMLNLPIGDTLALRLVGGDIYRSGWIDRILVAPAEVDGMAVPPSNFAAQPVLSDDKDVNTENLYGGRATLLWQPSDEFSATTMVMYQGIDMGGYDLFDSPPGSSSVEAHYENFPITEPVTDYVKIASLTVHANAGFADFTSATAFWDRRLTQDQDASASIYNANGSPPPLPYLGIPYYEIDPSHQFSQEFRLSSRGSDRLQWVTGAFFSDLHSTWIEESENPDNLLAPTHAYYDSINPYEMKQYALFGDGTFKFTNHWAFSTGLRWYKYQSQQIEDEWGFDSPNPPLPGPVPVADRPITRASDRGFNPRFNLSYTPTGDLTTYLSASKGFRPGGANQVFPPPNEFPFCSPAPLSFGPDSVWDYELGEKARMYDGWLQINSDVFYIKWNDIQQAPLLVCGYEYDTNVGNGRSFGPELEVDAKMSEHWRLTLSGTYTDSKITDPNAAYVAFLTTSAFRSAGVTWCTTAVNCTAPILNIPKETGSMSIIYTRDISNFTFSARVMDSFVGPQYDESYYFGIRLPGYNIVGARASLMRGNWTADLFIDNLTNKIAEVTANNTSFQFNSPDLVRYSTLPPLTIGTQINYRF